MMVRQAPHFNDLVRLAIEVLRLTSILASVDHFVVSDQVDYLLMTLGSHELGPLVQLHLHEALLQIFLPVLRCLQLLL